MIHGHRSDTKRMFPVIKFLEEKYNMICFDLPGFGKSKDCPKCENYIDLCAGLLDTFLKQMRLDTKEVFVVGISLGGNVLFNYLNDRRDVEFKKLGFVAPVYSYKHMGLKPALRTFVFWLTKNVKDGGLVARIAQWVIDSDRLFAFIVKRVDGEAYHSQDVIDYELSQWRLSTMQHWGKSLYDLLQMDYTTVTEPFSNHDVVFVYPNHDQYINAPESIDGFKRLFPKARFNYYPSDKHIPKGDFGSDPELLASMKKIVDALE
jgi:pimeloyl-ACP methyl ester carboxylesterase